MSITYSNYLKIDKLLSLAQPVADPPEHDEMLFIVIHQVYELWFKQLLFEFDRFKIELTENLLFDAVHRLKRVRTIMKTMVGQLDILETMTPMSFVSFRDRLEQASGFQSAQFRELEFLLGYKRPEMLKYHAEGTNARKALERRLRDRSVVDHFYDFLQTQGVDIPSELRERDLTKATQPNATIQAGILKMYRERPDVAVLLEQMIDYDEGQQEWRYRHVKMVERTIGNKQGTGGSPGAAYLRKSLFNPLFPDLWAIRQDL